MATTRRGNRSAQGHEAVVLHQAQEATRAPSSHDVAELIEVTARMALDTSDEDDEGDEDAEDDEDEDEDDEDLPVIVCVCTGSTRGGGEYSCTFQNEPELDTHHEMEATAPRAFWLAAQEAIRIAEEIDPNRTRRLQIWSRDGNMITTMNDWVHTWANNRWRRRGNNTPLENLDLIQWVYRHSRRRQNIEWIKI